MLEDRAIEEIVQLIIDKPLSVMYEGRNHYCGMVDGRIYRVIRDPQVITLLQSLFEDHAWMAQLFSLGMVKTSLVGSAKDGALVMEHEYLHYRPMFHEWTWQQTKDAACAIIRIQKLLYEKDCYLTDPHIFNITFEKSRPVYYDFGSIVPGAYLLKEWIRNFWLSQTMMASWFSRLQPSYAELQDFLSHPSFMTLDAQIEGIMKLERRGRTTEWSNYDKGDFDVNLADTWKEKHKAVRDLLLCLPEMPKSALDIGANIGDFCKILASVGIGSICGVDVDEPSMENLYATARSKRLPVDCMLSDLFDLFGWHVVDFGEDGWEKQYRPIRRLTSELVISVALVHHLSYFRNATFEEIAKVFSEFSTRYLIIEWIPYTDKYLEGPVNRHGVDKSWYTEERFVAALSQYFPRILSKKESTPGRVMYLFAKGI